MLARLSRDLFASCANATALSPTHIALLRRARSSSAQATSRQSTFGVHGSTNGGIDERRKLSVSTQIHAKYEIDKPDQAVVFLDASLFDASP